MRGEMLIDADDIPEFVRKLPNSWAYSPGFAPDLQFSPLTAGHRRKAALSRILCISFIGEPDPPSPGHAPASRVGCTPMAACTAMAAAIGGRTSRPSPPSTDLDFANARFGEKPPAPGFRISVKTLLIWYAPRSQHEGRHDTA